ncbi:hypothetical protein H112_02424 [Trichophyton rubrum D6]|uniref:Uncharacterized protein n=2 Tax=Trichophyton TaxID=5550 RepID=A0A022W9W9_TRIRU|nr:hypothetical protein H100_02426 [Trichophyton rubrum MR850]EZF44297.1 hypothetical protein H102_02422 [Trichophyton rubrum CBS 100081]EZF54936.1 hypothetical protein H103_02434 [Trichophyton rubrum CBS 288.86]EZF65534.1 hypothetical protein H104_02409 [Trichophyton rubrum CBS 289.86]EZF76158.1 hypothetical protein H105_02444 [Trichophyton soudanense CBS 452.61]EZF86846.1 hypothetical protein H110_02428 [Trichophyton rubrum MR1448]EZG19170.1 hypothetical protein H107_02507 [Trichophyton rub
MKGKLAPGLASAHIASARDMSSGHGRNRSEGLGVSGRWVMAPEAASSAIESKAVLSDWPAAAQAQPLSSRRQCSKQAGVSHPSTEDPPVGRDAGLNVSRFALRTFLTDNAPWYCSTEADETFITCQTTEIQRMTNMLTSLLSLHWIACLTNRINTRRQLGDSRSDIIVDSSYPYCKK